MQKGRLRKIHLAGDGLHPRVIARGGEDADGGGVTGERLVRERVHLDDAQGHGRKISPGAFTARGAPSLGVSSSGPLSARAPASGRVRSTSSTTANRSPGHR